jgi:hypothetical protein
MTVLPRTGRVSYPYHSSPARSRHRDPTGQPGIEGRDISGPTTGEAMTRSEEQLRVGGKQRESG